MTTSLGDELRATTHTATTSRSTAHHLVYRADIDGLRAIAVLSVVGFHAFPATIRSGFIGVDIFFVISGYLISSILFMDFGLGKFDYLDFYVRRVRRIFPALLLVLLAVLVTGWFTSLPDEYLLIGKHVASGTIFITNFVLKIESGYFDPSSELKPLLHLWSLAIEEQFYIFWPILLATWNRRSGFRVIVSAIALISFAYNLSIVGSDPVLAFYSPFSRIWELMIGGMLAQLSIARPDLLSRYGNARSVGGLALIAVGTFFIDPFGPYPSWRALLPCVGAFLLISAGPNALLNRTVLSSKVAVWFGKISYPLYLWHWPLLSFATVINEGKPGRATRAALVVLGIVLAWLTYRWIERPIRQARNSRRVALALVAGLVAVGAAGSFVWRENGMDFRFGDAGRFVSYFENSRPEMKYSMRIHSFELGREECNFYRMDDWRAGNPSATPREAIDPTCYTPRPGTVQSVFIWGDSHAQHLNFALRASLPDDVSLLQVATSACEAAVVEPEVVPSTACEKSNQFALATIRTNPPDVVVIAQRKHHDLETFRRLATLLKGAGVLEVIVVGPLPQWNPDLNKLLAKHYWGRFPDRLREHLDPDVLAVEQAITSAKRADEPFVYVDLFDKLCNGNGCLTYVDGDQRDGLITFDYGHLTPKAAEFVGRTVLGPVVVDLLQRDRNRGTHPSPATAPLAPARE